MDAIFEVEQIRRTGNFNMDSDHFHDFYEIYYLLSGERHYYIHNRIYALQAGDIVFINKNELHRTTSRNRSPHERILISFDEQFLSPVAGMDMDRLGILAGESFLLRPTAHEQGEIVDLLQAMLREQRDNQHRSRLYLQTLLLQLLIRLDRIRDAKPSAVNPEQSEGQRRVYDIIEYLDAHYREKLTLGGIAEHFFISTPYLCRTFKQTTGFTVVEYLNYVRIRETKALLKDTGWRVTRIARETGFESIAHFGRVFKGVTGRTPLQYRKQNRE
ncbi:AraC family transcriptional regulator [Paenibacillus sp. HW567]|uniref:AraC family transcriptional regulator n=1 Tax=Paenibacillus sp. HW567 TaxID=1034769 RepID=UPI00037161E8|nr:AraC family transcriptional regulator [Paenibacillus sp. HW567]